MKFKAGNKVKVIAKPDSLREIWVPTEYYLKEGVIISVDRGIPNNYLVLFDDGLDFWFRECDLQLHGWKQEIKK